MRMKENT